MLRAFALAVVAATFLSQADAQTPPPLLARPPERPVAKITLEGEELLKLAISHPTPKYPLEARRRHITGTGLYDLRVSYETGEVTSVAIETSTGHRLLDDSAVATFKTWKFRPHRAIRVKVPITFRMTSKA